LLGDNLYPHGASGPDDPLFDDRFERPYRGVDAPFYVVLGNHDYDAGLGLSIEKAQAEIDRSARSARWTLPDRYYRLSVGELDLFALDTNVAFYGDDPAQQAEVSAWVSASKARWKIAFGHHPYLSNGRHGDAGRYDGVPAWLHHASGDGVERFLAAAVCGKVDLYLSGHDHSRQWLEGTCAGTELAVSGAGASATSLPGKEPARFQSTELGFLYIKLTPAALEATFVDQAGRDDFTRTLTKAP
jgi:hypothetical protein